ncbi:SusC/RagA family TonB-linked outer membrane protein [Pedobacter sp. MC2016-14]|uniref:SusC/RagA family TonB-linked outer membrane protein n=1 Tax=Pedobacter sp. MC2016-14 TaxID=2897327 RepID=UPI001E5C3190|nr:SusC/RagA family TonB-linked outer membrane protein [Pedobacter sp. MC2016-14]MCD0488246.1 SusC/RagA family TonB-linked outer membrane protein [Pedobacter sp. MC2016-14]
MRIFTFYVKLNLLFTLFLLTTATLQAQQPVTVTGMVKAASDNLGIPGVSVLLKGTKTGAVTGPDGSFSLKVPEGKGILIFSFVGYKIQELPIPASHNLNVVLADDAAALSEVVVVGYGTTRKQDLTGSVTVVGSKDFQKGSITTPEQMLAGKVAGVAITSNGGQPGSGSTIRIRGGSSLSASNDPLFVIDGVPLEVNGVSGASNPLSFINPNDIENFTVLKDASAAAIYGARAANGVIIITTKKGISGDLKVGFTTVNSLSRIIAQTDVLNGDQIREIVNANGTAAQKAKLGTFNTNWQDLIYQDGLATDNNLSISGGVKGLPYRLSLGYQNQRGILRTDELEKTSAAFVLNPTFFDNHLKLDINLKGSMQKTRFANTAAIGGAVSFDPSQAVYTNRPDYLGYYEWLDYTTPSGLVNLVGRNPVGVLEQVENRANPLRSIGNIQLDYKFHFLPELHANVNAGYDIANGKGTTYVSPLAAVNINDQGYDNQYRQKRNNTVFDFYLNYVKVLPTLKSRIDATAGYSYNNYLTTAYNYASYNGYGVKVANTDPAFPFNKPENRLISYFGRLNYSYDERFLLTATLRRDGSSRFSSEYRNAMFPSVALAWTLKNETFLKDNKTISALKIRAGYGITGQQEGIDNYGYLSTYGLSSQTTSYQFGNTFYQMYRPTAYISNLKWEQTATTNVGIDAGFLDNRISGSVDMYLKKTTDLLNKVPQPAGTNFSASAVVNVGSMENKGVEMNVNFVPIKSADLNWDFSLNATYNKNTITNLTVVPNDANYVGLPGGSIAGGVGGQNALISSVGHSKSLFYLFEQVYDQSGKPIEGVYVDQNGDGLINENDLNRGKQADPKLFLGFSNNLSYKQWNMSFTLRANLGNYVYNNVSSQMGNLAQINGSAILLNASPSYLTTNFKTQQLFSDYYVENASFLKMDNINLGYRFGKVFKTNAALQLNASVQNVFTITNYTGLDPEVASGVDNNLYPRPRVFSLGLNLNF